MASRATLPNLAFRAFTLIELLVVIALIGILSAILIPTVGSARVSANKAKTKVVFSQWAVAMEQFKQEYGYYPKVTDSEHLLSPTLFLAALTGRNHLGMPLPKAELNGNTKSIAFYTPTDADFAKDAAGAILNELVDAFGNSDIVVLVDSDGNGMIRGSELVRRSIRVGNSGANFSHAVVPPIEEFPETGVRAGVLFYSAGRGKVEQDAVLSWR